MPSVPQEGKKELMALFELIELLRPAPSEHPALNHSTPHLTPNNFKTKTRLRNKRLHGTHFGHETTPIFKPPKYRVDEGKKLGQKR